MVDIHQHPVKRRAAAACQHTQRNAGQPTHPQQPRRTQPRLHIDARHREMWQWARALAATPCDATINRTPHSQWQPSHSRQHRYHDRALHGNKHKHTAITHNNTDAATR
jgi:hypothetical protein